MGTSCFSALLGPEGRRDSEMGCEGCFESGVVGGWQLGGGVSRGERWRMRGRGRRVRTGLESWRRGAHSFNERNIGGAAAKAAGGRRIESTLRI